ncbi:hypothetical protein LXL04_005465 [Taraxacum kok-saghyz]
MVAWKKIIVSHERGGLGIDSLFAFNRNLMFKWRWRYLNNLDALWVKVIMVLHGSARREIVHTGQLSPWRNINRSTGNLKSKGVDLEEFCHKIMRNVDTTRFWLDKWLGQYTLKENFPRFYMLDSNKETLINDQNSPDKLLNAFGRQSRSGVTNDQWHELCSTLRLETFSEGNDYFVWELASDGYFLVASTRCVIHQSLLEGSNGSTR